MGDSPVVRGKGEQGKFSQIIQRDSELNGLSLADPNLVRKNFGCCCYCCFFHSY